VCSHSRPSRLWSNSTEPVRMPAPST
jgi:hypothetical protein